MSRLQPLVRIILSEAQLNAESEFFFSEAKKLSLVKILLSSCGWRSFVFSKGLFVSYLGHINHHYQQVRELLGSNLNMCAQAQWHPSASDIWEIMRWNLSNKSGAYALLNASSPVPDLSGDIPLQLPEEWRVLMERLGDNLKVWKLEAKPVNLGPTNFGKAGKTRKCDEGG